MNSYSRRKFIATSGAATALSMSGVLPQVLSQTAAKLSETKDMRRGERVLVVLQLSGGNDSLNTLIPYGDDGYYQNRFTLAVGREQVLKLGDYCGLHPELRPLLASVENRRTAFVQGVGYPNPNRSHFESLDLWHTAHQMQAKPLRGWLGAAADRLPESGFTPLLQIGNEPIPVSLLGERVIPATLDAPESFQRSVDKIATASELRRLDASVPRDSKLLSRLQRTNETADQISARLRAAALSAPRSTVWPTTNLAQKFKQVADLIAADLPTRIYHLTFGGFDTHSNQEPAHGTLLSEWANAVAAFLRDLDEQGQAERVLLLTFSEFGRRLRENASRGTDHGAAGVVQLSGPEFPMPLLGKYPSLTDLDEGDLKYTMDYRELYASVLENWLSVDSAEILGGRFTPPNLWINSK
ncbi:MAG: DUF1501 domain-containing protein [Planctomycetaceae bacterium]|nr:DUF1501 domain-containing protein [Planctomycetaceae bacterium]